MFYWIIMIKKLYYNELNFQVGDVHEISFNVIIKDCVNFLNKLTSRAS